LLTSDSRECLQATVVRHKTMAMQESNHTMAVSIKRFHSMHYFVGHLIIFALRLAVRRELLFQHAMTVVFVSDNSRL
jgi:hypothetical protein